MTPDDYARLRELFLRGLELEPAERAQFVEEESAGELRAKLQRMLASVTQGEIVEDRRPAAETQASLAGTTVGRYRVVERIGEGGMAVVYRGEDVDLRRPVALKFLSPLLSHSPEARERFLREARAAAAIDHPNVCPVHEINADLDQPFIAMALLEGRTVAARLQSGSLEIEAAVDIALQACRGLEAAHAKGIVHRDIKPSNLMLVRPPTGVGREQVRILDFGIARYERDRTLTEPGAALGTIAYMSPEQIASADVDERSDLWSLGATFYEMLAGRPAFDRPTMRELGAAIAAAEPAPLSHLRKEVPERLDAVIKRLLRKDPKERFRSASDLAIVLEEVQREMQTAKPGTPASRPSATASWRKVAVAAGVLLAGGLAYWAFSGSEPASPPQAELLEPIAVTTYPGVEYAPALSPDGQSLAFIWDGGESGTADLYVQQIGAFEPLRLTDTPESEGSPTWSPDGSQIAFVRSDGSNRSILAIPATGGAEELVVDLPGPSGAANLDWSPRGDMMVLERDDAVVGLRLSDPNAPPIHYEEGGFNADLPRFDPKGERIAFMERRSKGAVEFVVAPVSGDKSAVRRYRDPTLVDDLLSFTWSGDGKSLIYARRREAPFLALRLDDGSAEALPIVSQNAWGPQIRGKRLVYSSRVKWDSNIWVADLEQARATGRPVTSRRLIESSMREHGARFSPDGRSIVFVSDRSGALELWRCDAQGRSLEKLTSIGIHNLGSASWSPDGAWIAFDAVIEDRERDIYVIPAEGGPPKRITQSPAADMIPNWSADGRWIYFASDRAGNLDIWRIPLEGGEAERVTTGGGFEAYPTRDGRYLYYSDRIRNVLTRRDLLRDEEVAFPELGGVSISRFWCPAEDGIYFSSRDDPAWIRFLDFETGSIRRICAFGERERGPRPISLSPDGRTLIFTQRDDYDQDIMMVEGL